MTRIANNLFIVLIRVLLWCQLPYILVLGLPLTFPGRFLDQGYTPRLVLLLFVLWPLTIWLAWWHQAEFPRMTRPMLTAQTLLILTIPLSLSVTPNLQLGWLMTAQLAWGIALGMALLSWPPTQRYPGLLALGIITFAIGLSLIGPPLLDLTLPSMHATILFLMLTPVVTALGETINPNILAGGILPAIPLALALSLMPWGTRWSGRVIGLLRMLLLLLLASWLLRILILTDSRAAVASALLACVLVVVLRWTKLTVPAIIVAILATTWLIFNVPWSQLNALMDKDITAAYGMRMEIWLRTWHTMLAHPLTGIGFGGFVPVVIEEMNLTRTPLSPTVTHAHNLWLQVALDLGIFGLVSYVACQVIALTFAVRGYRRGQGARQVISVGVIAAITAVCLHGVIDAPLWNSKLAFLPWLFFALAGLSAEDHHSSSF